MMAFLQQHRLALLIVGLYLALGALYGVASPLFEPSDEHNHYPFVQHLARGGSLPIQDPAKRALWEQEGSQPPLYYALMAALTSWINTDDMTARLYRNPHDRRGVPAATDNRNMYVHTEAEAFPWRDTALAVHLIRFFSVLLGVGTILCTYAIARALFPGRPAVAPLALAINAFLPMFIFISASVNNDNLVIALSALALLMLVRMTQRGAAPARLLGLGVVIGLACLTKLSALGLLPLACLALAFQHGRSAHPRSAGGRVLRWIRDCALVILLTLMVAGWWYLRNWQLYGDPLGLSAMVTIAGGRPPLRSLADLWGEFYGFRASFWGVLGGFNILLRPAWIYGLLDLLTVLALAGLAVWGWRAWRGRPQTPSPDQATASGAGLILLAAWIGIEAVALVRWTSVTLASQRRLMFAALPAICLFLALGLAGWLPPRGQRFAAWGIGGLLFLLAASTPFTAIRPAYAPAPLLTPADVPDSAQRFDVDYGGVMRLLAFDVGHARVRPGDLLLVTLYWQMLTPVREDFSIYLQLFGWQQELGQRDSYPGGGTRPTSRLAPGQVVADTYLVPVRADARGPAPAWLSAGLYRLSTQEKLPATDAQGRPVIFPILTKLALDTAAPNLAGAHPLGANLGDRLRLTSYDLAGARIRPGQEMTVTLFWHAVTATAPLNADYTVFLHLRDAADHTVAQADAPPLQGFYRTSAWQVGEILNDTHRLTLPADLKPGPYRIIVGLYDPQTGQRLPLLDAAGKDAGNEVVVATVQAGP